VYQGPLSSYESLVDQLNLSLCLCRSINLSSLLVDGTFNLSLCLSIDQSLLFVGQRNVQSLSLFINGTFVLSLSIVPFLFSNRLNESLFLSLSIDRFSLYQSTGSLFTNRMNVNQSIGYLFINRQVLSLPIE
jgi:hypothetical protein